MGGLAVIIDWQNPVELQDTVQMMDRVPHRCSSGLRSNGTLNAALSEGRNRESDDGWNIASVGPLTIVGDLRLWQRERLVSLAGGSRSSRIGDRNLILSAYQRCGWQRTLDALDGDFAFVIWDAENRVALAARDRFGVMPLFWSQTHTGIRFASEPKQLLTGDPAMNLDHVSIASHLAGRPPPARHTYFEGISRVMPSEVMIISQHDFQQSLYWDPEPSPVPHARRTDVPRIFREHLVDAVRRRLDTSQTTVSQLSGGLDSTSIAAAANILVQAGKAHESFATVSAVFPGTSSDESSLIDEVVASQPFTHRSFEPPSATLNDYSDVMGQIDGPRVSPTHLLETGTAEFATNLDADLVLTGLGGDDVLDDSRLLVDLLEGGSLQAWWRLARQTSTHYGAPTMSVALPSMLTAIPERGKTLLRRMIRERRQEPTDLMRAELRSHASESERVNVRRPYPSRTQAAIRSETRSSLVAQVNEYVEARLSRSGLGVSHPFLDREIVEFILSIPVTDRPADGRSKALVRQAFHGSLPASVLTKPRKAAANAYILTEFARLGGLFSDRYPAVPAFGVPFVDADRYEYALRQFETATATLESFKVLWPAWTMFLWLDSLDGRHDHRNH